mmetsp:Transcript_44475/g.96763  ORF Transcript_44475/g.96763 Transcript_44475/m.96763 type:complete len:80 (+) Transcript_44475:552-791(+)
MTRMRLLGRVLAGAVEYKACLAAVTWASGFAEPLYRPEQKSAEVLKVAAAPPLRGSADRKARPFPFGFAPRQPHGSPDA